MVVVLAALCTSTNPAPACDSVCSGSPSVKLLGTLWAVVSKSVLMLLPTAADFPFTSNSNAELPAMKGVAMDVPERRANEPSGTGNVERMLPPGAATAGLKNISLDGPYEEKVEMSPPVGLGKLKLPPVCGKDRVRGAFAANCPTSCGIVCIRYRIGRNEVERTKTPSAAWINEA